MEDDALDSFWRYLNEKIDDKELLFKFVEKTPLGNMLYKKLLEVDDSKREKYSNNRALLKLRNSIFRDELIKFNNSCIESGIKLLHLKGMILADDLYETIEDRYFCDIDVLVGKDDVQSTINVLDNLGFHEVDPYCPQYTADNIGILIDNSVTCHLVFAKQIGKHFTIPVELHFEIIQPDFMKLDSSDFINKSIQHDFHGSKVCILDTNHRLLHLIMHFLHHSYLLHFGDAGFNVNISNLHDIALLIDKYKHGISWEQISDFFVKNSLATNFLFFSHVFSAIYPGRIPIHIVDSMIGYASEEEDIREKYYLKQFIFRDPFEIIDRGIYSILKDNVIGNRIKGQELQCKFCDHLDGRIDFPSFMIDEYSDKIENRFGSHVCIGKKPMTNFDCSGYGKVGWNSAYFLFNIRVYDDKCVFIENQRGNKPFEFDGVELIFANTENKENRFFWKHIIVNPLKDQSNSSICVFDVSNGTDIIPSELYEYEYTRHQDGYEIYLMLTWGLIGIEPYKGLNIGFDIAINDNDECYRKTRLSWSCKGNGWYDIRSFGMLSLV